MDSVQFNFGLALLAANQDEKAIAAYERAARNFPGQIELLGLSDVRAATGNWLVEDRAKPVLSVLSSFLPGAIGVE